MRILAVCSLHERVSLVIVQNASLNRIPVSECTHDPRNRSRTTLPRLTIVKLIVLTGVWIRAEHFL